MILRNTRCNDEDEYYILLTGSKIFYLFCAMTNKCQQDDSINIQIVYTATTQTDFIIATK